MRRAFCILFLVLLAACARVETPPLRIAHVVMTGEKIVQGKDLPTFTDHFDEGKDVIYAYVFFENMMTMTGSFPVRLQWFYPNDFRPPIGMSSVTMTSPSTVAEFALHDATGIKKGPYQALVFAGEPVTATGSARFFIGMTQKEALEFLEQEVKVREEMEKSRKETEEKAKLEEKEKGTGSGEMMGGPGDGEGVKGQEGVKVEEELPPALTGGMEEEGSLPER